MALSPMMQFYMQLKEQYKDAIVFFRLGDFYEMFFDDALVASEVLDLTLTGRDCGLEERAPMCGVPYHAAEGYIQKLVTNGYKVAICEQIGDASKSKGLVERDVVRVVTAGTVIEDNLLDEKKNNYLASIIADSKNFAVAWIDISTGEFNVIYRPYNCFDDIEDVLSIFNPSEIICNDIVFDKSKQIPSMRLDKYPKFQNYHKWSFDYDNATKILLKQFDIATLDKFELSDKKLAVSACGAIINYINETQKRDLSHIADIKLTHSNKYLVLDSTARRNLELCENNRDNSKKGSLLWVIDKTKTSMGARNLRRWLEQPLRDSVVINQRLDSVEELTQNTRVRSNISNLLVNVKDIQRLASKISYGNPTPRDLVALKCSLQQIPSIKEVLSVCSSSLIKQLNDKIFCLDNTLQLLESSILEEAPAVIKDGGFIKKGYNSQLDELYNAKENGQNWLNKLEEYERQETGIKNLRIGYNKVFGYYIELSKSNVDKAPIRYVRKQTLTNGERYITDDLKKIEEKLLGAVENAIALEILLFDQIKEHLFTIIAELQSTASSIATLDSLLSLAIVAVSNNYCKPTINDNIDNIKIVDGRHPVVEIISQTNNFVCNDTLLDNCQNRTMIITGPNMAGKSTYMRQVALITLLAHIGSFVPAKSADIAITDRIFTRIGASDDLAYGQSTFMVEMVEVATILQNATLKSLLILDEIGRGTSTFDGLSIARAVIEDVSQRLRCRTLFSTHYHELTEMQEHYEGINNYKILATEKNKGIVFLHKIMPGGTNKSFGIEVAKLAGVPNKVIMRAREISKMLELNPISTLTDNQIEIPELLQIDTKVADDKFKQQLSQIDTNNLTPIQAFNKLNELVVWAKEES